MTSLKIVFPILFLIISSLVTGAETEETTGTCVRLEVISNTELGGNAHAIALQGNLAYVSMNYDGLAIVDISKTQTPRIIKHVKDAIAPLFLVLDGTIAYEGDRKFGFQVLDLQNPHAPTVLQRIPYPTMVVHINQVGDHLYLACGSEGMVTIRTIPDYPYAEFKNIFRRVDFSRSILLSEKTLYLADGQFGGLKIFDISAPSTPTLAAVYDLKGTCDVIAKKDEVLFVAKRQAGIIVTDISIRHAPCVIGHVKRMYDSIKDLKIDRSFLFMASNKGIEIFDISNPSEPKPCGFYATRSVPYHIIIRDNILYVADWDAGLTLFKIVYD